MTGGIDVDGFKDFKMTEEKVRKLMPIVEKIWSREFGVDLKLNNLTVGGVTVWREDDKIKKGSMKNKSFRNKQNKK